jgi:hypothetical protein
VDRAPLKNYSVSHQEGGYIPWALCTKQQSVKMIHEVYIWIDMCTYRGNRMKILNLGIFSTAPQAGAGMIERETTLKKK